MTARATASAESDGGTVRARGVGKSRALPGGSPTGAASRRLASRPASAGRWWLAVTRPPAPAPRVKQRLTGTEQPKPQISEYNDKLGIPYKREVMPTWEVITLGTSAMASDSITRR